MKRSEILRKLLVVSWYQSFEVIPGIKPPAPHTYRAKDVCHRWLEFGTDLSGLNILEIGAWDGPLSFELEQRGACVTAFDIQNPDNTGFNTAKTLRGSKVEYIQDTVYNLSACFYPGQFDFIIMLGVLYHLRHPLLAIEQLNAICGDETTVILEGEFLKHYAEDGDGKPLPRKFAEDIASSSGPFCLVAPGNYKGVSNWYVPNWTCLMNWFTTSGFEVSKSRETNTDYPGQRFVAFLRKTSDPVPDHAVVPPSWLHDLPEVALERDRIVREIEELEKRGE